MARLMAAADGVFTSSGTWVVVDAATALVTEGGTGRTALTTASQNSANIQPTSNITIDAIAIKVADVAGSTGSVTMVLYNVTTTASVVSLTIPIADLPQGTSNGAGLRAGWVLFATGDQNLTSGSNYQIRLNFSSGSSVVGVMTNGTTANWQHMFRTKTAAAPGASDDLFVLGLWTASGTWTQYAVTMDNTATTTFGSNPGAAAPTERSGLCIGKSTVAWGTTASTAYVLKLAGSVNIYPGGTMTIGTSGTPVPDTSTATLTLMTTAGYAVSVCVGGTLNSYGSPRTSGKAVNWCNLTADMTSGSTTTASVNADTGWKNGDTVYIGTSRPATMADAAEYTLSGDATSGSVVLSGAVTANYKGTAPFPFPAPVVLTKYNVEITSDSSSRLMAWAVYGTGLWNMQWTKLTYMGICTLSGVTSNLTWRYCCLCQNNGTGTQNVAPSGTAGGTWSLRDIVFISGANASVWNSSLAAASTVTNHTFADFVFIFDAASGSMSVTMDAQDNVITGMRMYGGGGTFSLAFLDVTAACGTAFLADSVIYLSGTFNLANAAGNWTMSNAKIHAGTQCVNLGASFLDLTFESCTLTYSGHLCVSGTAAKHYGITFSNCTISGLAHLSDTPSGVWQCFSSQVGTVDVKFLNCDFEPAWGVLPSFFFDGNQGGTIVEPLDLSIAAVDCNGAFTNVIDDPVNCVFTKRSIVTFNNFDRTGGDHRVWRARANGWLQTDASVYNTAAPSEKMTPSTAAVKLESSYKRFAVAAGGTATVTVYVRKNAAYNGAAPRLIIKRNDSAGITADVVGDTHTAAADAWEQLTYTTSAVADDCVIECCVDCDGTAGVVYVDDWAAS